MMIASDSLIQHRVVSIFIVLEEIINQVNNFHFNLCHLLTSSINIYILVYVDKIGAEVFIFDLYIYLFFCTGC